MPLTPLRMTCRCAVIGPGRLFKGLATQKISYFWTTHIRPDSWQHFLNFLQDNCDGRRLNYRFRELIFATCWPCMFVAFFLVLRAEQCSKSKLDHFLDNLSNVWKVFSTFGCHVHIFRGIILHAESTVPGWPPSCAYAITLCLCGLRIAAAHCCPESAQCVLWLVLLCRMWLLCAR